MAPAVVVLSRVLQFMLVFLPGVCWTYEVVQSVEGSVAADETKHYTVDVVGVVVVALLTDEGDADLYASTVVKEPDYSNSQSSSCSCGLDLIVLATSKGVESEHVYLSVVGHAWHERSHYKLAIIAPSKNDITNYQVWDHDPESGREVLLVDYDSLQIANDHSLHMLLDTLTRDGKGAEYQKGVWPTVAHLAEWGFYLFLETLKIMIEIFL